jgi:hypothetical protein
MNHFTRSLTALATAAILTSGAAFAGPAEDVAHLQQAWAQAKYQAPAASQEQQF